MIHHGYDQILGNIHGLKSIDASLNAHAITNRNKNLQGRVTCTSTQTGKGSVDAICTRCDSSNRVGNAHRHIVVPVKTQLCLGFKFGPGKGNA